MCATLLISVAVAWLVANMSYLWFGYATSRPTIKYIFLQGKFGANPTLTRNRKTDKHLFKSDYL
jgi:hypothetical protein